MRKPVFVIGSPRSGTTLLYHMLLSAGDFVLYRAETHVFNMIAPRFGDLRTRADRRAFLSHWLKSKFFRRTGLSADDLVRDGRDVALSVSEQGDSQAARQRYYCCCCRRPLLGMDGRDSIRKLDPYSADVMEVRFEDLVHQPRRELKRIGDFSDHDLDYDRIISVGIGSVSVPTRRSAMNFRQAVTSTPSRGGSPRARVRS